MEDTQFESIGINIATQNQVVVAGPKTKIKYPTPKSYIVKVIPHADGKSSVQAHLTKVHCRKLKILSSACRVAVRRKNSTLWTTPLTVWHIRGWRIRWRDQTVGHWYTIQQTGVQTKRIQSLKSLWQININCKTTRVKCEVNAWQICRWIWTSEKPNQCVEWKLLLKGCLSWLETSVFSQREQPESYCLSFSCHIKFNGIEN
jgi:hypothetical protein